MVALVGLVVLPVVTFRCGVERRPTSEPVHRDTSPVTAHPVRKVLREMVSLQGTTVRRAIVRITAPIENGPLVVTDRGPALGERLTVGMKGPGINGTSGVVLDLAVAPYRDLAVGATGPDVRALNECLTRAGFSEVAPDGDVLTVAGASAVRTLFARMGASAVDHVDSAPADALRSARAGLAGAERSLAQEREALSRAIDDGHAAVADALDALDGARRQQTIGDAEAGAAVASAERDAAAGATAGDQSAAAAAQDALRLAQLRRIDVAVTGRATVEAAERRLAAAQSALQNARVAVPDTSGVEAARAALDAAVAADAAQVVLAADRVIPIAPDSSPTVTTAAPPVGSSLKPGGLVMAAGSDLAIAVDLGRSGVKPTAETKVIVTAGTTTFEARSDLSQPSPDDTSAASGAAGNPTSMIDVPSDVVLPVDGPVVVDVVLDETPAPVIAVPVSALWRGRDRTEVRFAGASASGERAVSVTVGLIVDGWAEVVSPRLDMSSRLVLRTGTS